MSTYIQPYSKPIKAEELNGCECIKLMAGAYFQPPKQSETSCCGYRNPYTGKPSHVCNGCKWFSDNQDIAVRTGQVDEKMGDVL